jgi:DNA-binding protein H-NS
MSVKELLEFQAIITEAITTRKVTERAEVKAKMAALAMESGFSFEELMGLKKGKNGMKSVNQPKYRNPGNAEETWTGRGRKPNWLVERMKKRGASMDDFLI